MADTIGDYTATNPDTGETIYYDSSSGQWAPITQEMLGGQ